MGKFSSSFRMFSWLGPLIAVGPAPAASTSARRTAALVKKSTAAQESPINQGRVAPVTARGLIEVRGGLREAHLEKLRLIRVRAAFLLKHP